MALPTIETPKATLREVVGRDANALASALGKAEVMEHLPVGPTTPEQFARFIRWVRRERRAGRYLCFAVVPCATRTTAGVFQLWPIEPGFGTAEIGFALDPSLWGTGTFHTCAVAIIDFAFHALGVHRIECRSAVTNGRGAGALRKLGAVYEGTLRRCFACPSGLVDHAMWSILSDEWNPSGGKRRVRAA